MSLTETTLPVPAAVLVLLCSACVHPPVPGSIEARNQPLIVAATDSTGSIRLPSVVHTVKPRLLNAPDVDRAIEREMSQLLDDPRIEIEGTTTVYVFIDAERIVRQVLVGKSSGHAALDTAARRAARIAKFSPARNVQEPVALWITLKISFQVRQS